MSVTNKSLPLFALSAPSDLDQCQSLVYDGTRALRLAVNGESAGILAATSYFYVSLGLWLDSTTSGGVYLMECGRTTGYAIGYHTDPVDNGNDAICVATNDGNSGTAYAARFEVNLLSTVGNKTLHSVEVQYIENTGFTCFVDGVSIAQTAVGGTDTGVGSASLTTDCTLGGSVNLNTLRTRGALNQSSIVGIQSKWPSGDTGTTTSGQINGGITYARIDLEPGVPVMDMNLDGDVVDAVDTGNTGVNHVTNGTSWLAAGGSLSYLLLIGFLLSDTNQNELPAKTNRAAKLGGTSPTNTVRLWNPSSASFACSGFTVTPAGVTSVQKYIEFDGTEVLPGSFSGLTIAAGEYINVVVEHSTAIKGASQTGSVTWAAGDQSHLATYSLTVTDQIGDQSRSRVRSRSR